MTAMSDALEDWFRGKVAIVTGASLGIGRGVAEMLTDAGVSVVVTGRAQARMEVAAETLRARGGATVVGLGADVTDVDDARRMVDLTLQRFGRLDFLVNSAGTRSHSRVEDTTLQAWNEVVDVQLTGTFLSCQAAIEPLLQTRGRIVNMTSLFGYMGRTNGASYAAAKMGVVAFTKVLAQELAPHVTVNAVAPGPVETERFLPNASDGERERERLRRAAPLPLKRVGWPEDIAWATKYLLGPGGTWVTGQVLHVNGGAYMP
jgi:NAD(P)-dependent dehydrogenase (short-subunit alcohol dehydrogenase family)